MPTDPHGAEERPTLSELVRRLEMRVAEDNRFCICGCPIEDHEDYGEDGESCGDPDHECLRAAPAVVAAFAALRATLQQERERAEEFRAMLATCEWCGRVCPRDVPPDPSEQWWRGEEAHHEPWCEWLQARGDIGRD